MNGKHKKILSALCNSSKIAIERHIASWDKEIEKGGYLKGYAKSWMANIKSNIENLCEMYPEYLVDRETARKLMGEAFNYFKFKIGRAEIGRWTLEKDFLPDDMAMSLITLRFNIYYIGKQCSLQLERDGILETFRRVETNFKYLYERFEKELLILSEEELEKLKEEKFSKKEVKEFKKEKVETIELEKKETNKEKFENTEKAVKQIYGSPIATRKIQEMLGTNHCVDGKCINCGECCSLDVALNKNEYRKLRNLIKEKHIEKYYDMLRNGYFKDECPFRIDGKCDIYNSPSKPSICKIYICDAVEFQKTITSKGIQKPEKYMFDLLPSELKDLLNNEPGWVNRKKLKGGLF